MRCPHCKVVLKNEELFCPNCGQRLVLKSKSNKQTDELWQEYKKQANAEAKRLKEREQERKRAIRAKRRKRALLLLLCASSLFLIVATIFYINVIKPAGKYSDANSLYTKGKYIDAAEIFSDLGSYRDSAERVNDCYYALALSKYENGEFEEALTIFEGLADYKDSVQFKIACNRGIIENIFPKFEWNFLNNRFDSNVDESEIYGDTQVQDLSDDVVGSAIYLDGDGDYIDCGMDINLPQDFTFNTLLKCYDVYKDYSAFFAKYENNGGPFAFSIHQGHVNCWFTNENGRSVQIESTGVIQNNKWSFISIVKQGDSLKIYIDGHLDTEGKIDAVIQNDELVTIGRQALLFEPVEELQFTGYIGYMNIFDCALTLDQILLTYPMDLNVIDNTNFENDALLYEHPFNQKYWVIFTEGSRNDRIELSTVDTSLPEENVTLIWDRSLSLSDSTGSSDCEQYYLDELGNWASIGSYHRLSDNASGILASNVDVYDRTGNLIIKKCTYSEVDWKMIDSYK